MIKYRATISVHGVVVWDRVFMSREEANEEGRKFLEGNPQLMILITTGSMADEEWVQARLEEVEVSCC